MGDKTARSAGAPARVLRWAGLGVLLAATAAVLVVLAFRATPPGRPDAQVVAPVTATTTRATTSPVAPASPPGTSASPAAERPVQPQHLSIPSIAVSTNLVRLGLHADHTVEVPRDASRAGWYEHGPPPGQLGSAVVLGHVDSAEGPAVFYRLAELQPGDQILVRLGDGSVARFAVRRVATYANADFPAEQVYAGDPDRRLLNLVTCGGGYDADRGGWQGNVVVYAELAAGG